HRLVVAAAAILTADAQAMAATGFSRSMRIPWLAVPCLLAACATPTDGGPAESRPAGDRPADIRGADYPDRGRRRPRRRRLARRIARSGGPAQAALGALRRLHRTDRRARSSR